MQTKEPIHQARRGYKSVVLLDAEAVEKRLRILQTFPEVGCPYDSEFPSAAPDHEALVTVADHKGIYYTVVAIEWIRDVCMDPMAKVVSGDS